MTTHDTALPITTLLPETAADPVTLFDQHAALRFAIVDRDHAMRISAEEWDRPGVYILLDLPSSDGSWGCYVGKAPGGIRTRLRDHVRNKEHWRRAVLIQARHHLRVQLSTGDLARRTALRPAGRRRGRASAQREPALR